jgi:hypothetical protein
MWVLLILLSQGVVAIETNSYNKSVCLDMAQQVREQIGSTDVVTTCIQKHP